MYDYTTKTKQCVNQKDELKKNKTTKTYVGSSPTPRNDK